MDTHRAAGREDVVRAVVARLLPGRATSSLRLIGQGTDHVAYEVDGEIIVRIAIGRDPALGAGDVRREARLLELVAGASPLPTPVPLFVDEAAGCLAYRRLPGVPLLDVADRAAFSDGRTLARVLGAFLARLRAIPVEGVEPLVERDVPPLDAWRDEARDAFRRVSRAVPSILHARIEAFLDSPAPPPGSRPVFSHNDLGIEHVLVDPMTGRATGVIDWTDAAIVDPAIDPGRLYRDLGPTFLDQILEAGAWTEPVVAVHERAVFYGRSMVFEDIEFGLESGRTRYVEKGLRALSWLFPS